MTHPRDLTFPHKRSADQDRAHPGAASDRHRGGRAGGAGGCARPRAQGSSQRRHRCQEQSVRRQPGDLLGQAQPGDHGPAGARPGSGRQGRHLEERQGVFRPAAGVCLRPAAGRRSSPAGLHQPAAVLLRACLHRGGGQDRPDRRALAGGGAGSRADRRRRAADDCHAGGFLSRPGRLGDRGGRRALHDAAAAWASRSRAACSRTSS